MHLEIVRVRVAADVHVVESFVSVSAAGNINISCWARIKA